MKYYSQHGEEALIEKYIGEKPSGVYVDIGAGYPEEISNTYYFYCRGWYGLCIEPNPKWNDEWAQKRPRDVFLNAVITDKDCDSVTMFDNGMEGSYVGEDRKRLNTPPFAAPGVQLMTLLEKHPEFKEPDFMSLDVDSGEIFVLRTVDFSVFKPKLIVIEYTLRGIDFTDKWQHLLKDYEWKENFGGNAFYIRK